MRHRGGVEGGVESLHGTCAAVHLDVGDVAEEVDFLIGVEKAGEICESARVRKGKLGPRINITWVRGGSK